MIKEDMPDFKMDTQAEVVFPKEIFGDGDIGVKADDFDNLTNLLNSLNKKVTEVDGNVDNFVKLKAEIEQKQAEIESERRALNDARFNFEQQMKKERQSLEDMKIDFEQEKKRIFNEIEAERAHLEKNKRNFEKHRSEQMILIEQNKKMLTKNYQQFESIVNSFNAKIDKFDSENK